MVKTEIGDERLINDFSETSWKAINDELSSRRQHSETIAALIHEMSLRLEEAKDQKEMQDLQRMDSSFVVLYKRERLIGDRPEIAVLCTSVGFNTMQGAQQGYEGDMIPLGPAEDGDEIIVKRGVVRINTPIFLNCDLTFSREKNYAGGGGGGWSGGGGGGYGLGGGGGGGTYVDAAGTNVEIKVGTEYKKGHEVIVGNTGDGSVWIREPIMNEEWHFECINGAEEWLPPRTCIYIVKAMGGAGASAGSFKGGTGASVEAMFQLEENVGVILVCGRKGSTYTDRWGSCGGGGGATCIFREKIEAKCALIVAGGGGGAAAPFSSNGSDGGHANMMQEGKNGLGAFHGEGGKGGGAGSARHVRTCFLDSKMGCDRFMSEDKVKTIWRKSSGFFPGAGSGILEFALGSAPGASQGDIPEGQAGVAQGGFGGGGCGDWHPEETRIEGHCVDSIFHCRAGNPIVCDQVLHLSGHVPGAEFQPQCILVDGGILQAERIDMTCEEGNACVSKTHKQTRHDTSRGLIRLDDCTVNNCGGNGLLVLDGAALEASNCILTSCKKDGVDVKGKGSTAVVTKCRMLKTGARAVIVSKGARVEAMDCTMDKSRSSACVVMGQGSSLKMQRCTLTDTIKHGVMVSESASCEMRKCNVLSSHDVGVLALGVEDKVMEEETCVRLIHCVLKKNGYGVWSQDAADLTMLGGLVTGSTNEDVTQHNQPKMKTAHKLVSLGAETRVVFLTWKKEAQMSKALHQQLDGLTNDELDLKIRSIFNEFDADGSGEIQEAELGDALESLGVKLNESEIHHILKEMDENNDGLLSVAEFTLFCYRLVHRKREDSRNKEAYVAQQQEHEAAETQHRHDHQNQFCIPDEGCAIVVRSFRTLVEQLCRSAQTYASHVMTDEDMVYPCSDQPLAFSTHRSSHGPEENDENMRFVEQFREILQECADGKHAVSQYFWGSLALSHALRDADDGDVVLLGRGCHLLPGRFQMQKSIGICAIDAGASKECEVICQTGDTFEILADRFLFLGLKLTSVVEASSGTCIINVRRGDVLLRNCTMKSMSGCSIVCAVEDKDSNVMCYECHFINGRHGDVALIARDGAAAVMFKCHLLACSLYATSGGLIQVDTTQIVESVNDSIVVDSDGVIKARNTKIIGSLRNGVTTQLRGMLTMHSCAIIRSQKLGILCSGSGSTLRATESYVREGWWHSVSYSCFSPPIWDYCAIAHTICSLFFTEWLQLSVPRCDAFALRHAYSLHNPSSPPVVLQAAIYEGAKAEFENCHLIVNKGAGCIAQGAAVRLKIVDSVSLDRLLSEGERMCQHVGCT